MLWFIIYWYISKISVNISGLYIRRYILYVRYTALHVPFYQLFKYKSPVQIHKYYQIYQNPYSYYSGTLWTTLLWFFWDLVKSFWFTGMHINLQGNVHIFLLIFYWYLLISLIFSFYCDHSGDLFLLIFSFYWYISNISRSTDITDIDISNLGLQSARGKREEGGCVTNVKNTISLH